MFKSYYTTGTTKIVDVFVNDNNPNVDIGVDSNGDKHFVFTQRVASDNWVIEHNLGKYPSVTVVDSADNVVMGDVIYLSKNRLEVIFVSPFSGKAYLN